MKSTNLHVERLLSVLSARGIEKQLASLPGVLLGDVNRVSGCATVVYDETKIDVASVKARIARRAGRHADGG
jgi:Cu2+-exporting ATPase